MNLYRDTEESEPVRLPALIPCVVKWWNLQEMSNIKMHAVIALISLSLIIILLYCLKRDSHKK